MTLQGFSHTVLCFISTIVPIGPLAGCEKKTLFAYLVWLVYIKKYLSLEASYFPLPLEIPKMGVVSSHKVW